MEFYCSPINVLKRHFRDMVTVIFVRYIYICAVNFFLSSVKHTNTLFKTINQLTKVPEISHQPSHFSDDRLQKQVILHVNIIFFQYFQFCYVFFVNNF